MRRNRAQEKKLVAQFCMNRLVKCENSSVWVSDLFELFRHMYNLNLSIDSFGRLIPKVYERQILSQPGEITRRAIMGYKLV